MDSPRTRDQTPPTATVLAEVVSIHGQEAASLYETGMAQRRLPHVNLEALARLDERIAAHLSGLSVAGAHATSVLEAELAQPSIGGAFALSVHSIVNRDAASLQRLWACASENPFVLQGIVAAHGWVERRHLQGLVRDLLRSADPMTRAAGLGACAMHRVDPGLESGSWLDDPVPAVRARALRAAGELGVRNLTPRCVTAMTDKDPECRWWAAWSGVLLGKRADALDALCQSALNAEAVHRRRAFELMLQTMDLPLAHATLQTLSGDSAQIRWLVQGSAIAGDPSYVPWLLSLGAAPETARLAGEAFTLITGANLDALQLWRAQPNDLESSPNENPEDENVEMDPDEGLMWPDVAKVEQWWVKNSSRFQPGTRYFMGAPVTREHCIDVLKNGYQRQRILAAHYLCLLEPGTPLFNTSAPAWRQQKLLAQM